MKSITYTIVLVLFIGLPSLNAQLRTPALSPGAVIKQTVGLTDIEIVYSRPAVKGRTIFGKNGIIPYGEFWRTGANGATKINFGNAISINKTRLEKGDYTILTKPNSSYWEVFFYPFEGPTWSDYVDKKPILVIKESVENLKYKIESLEYAIQNITMDGADLEISWDRSRIRIPLKIDTKTQVLKNIERTMSGPNIFEHYNAALYLHENNIELPKALEYIQRSTSHKNVRFFMVYREALILKDLGKRKEAIVAAKRSLTMSKKAKNNDFIRLSEKLISTL